MVTPRISIVIPCHNYGRYLEHSIAAVFSQTIGDKEVIVIDDGSTDDTKQQVLSAQRRFGPDYVRYVYQNNQGVSSARNRGLLHSTGKYVIFLDADDFWEPELLEKEQQCFLKNYDVGMVYCWHEYYDDKDGKLYPASTIMGNPSARNFHQLLLENSCAASSVMVRKDLIQQLGGFDSRYSNAADWHMWLRIASVSQIDVVEESLAYIRIHSANMSEDKLSMNRERLEIINELGAKHSLKPIIRPRRWRNYRAQMEYNVVVASILRGQWPQARTHLIRAIGIRPFWWRLWGQLLRCTIQPIINR